MLLEGDKQVCKDFDLRLNVSKVQCERHAQMGIALWANEHSKWTVKSYKCLAENKKEEKI